MDITAVILAGGDASRFQREPSGISDKCLMAPVDVPLIDYTLDNIRLMGVHRIIVVGRRNLNALRLHLEAVAADLDVTLLPRSPKDGLAYALEVIRPYIHSPFVLLCGDEVYLDTNFDEMLPWFRDSGADGVCVVRPGGTRALLQNYAVETKGGRIVVLNEKPAAISPTALMGCGMWILPPEVFSCLEETPLHPRTGKRELVDVIGTLIGKGADFKPFEVKGKYINVNRREDFVSARKLILDYMMGKGKLPPDLPPPLLQEIQLEPTVRCNLNCVMCTNQRRLEPCEDMSLETFEMIVEQIPEIQIARLHGIGESLLNPHHLDFCRYLKSKNCFVAFNDNFTLITEEVASEIVSTGLDEIRVSCDAATPDLYARIRGKDALPVLKRGVGYIHAAKRASGTALPKQIMVVVIMKENLGQLAAIAEFAAELGVDEVAFQNQLNWGSGERTLGFAVEEAEEAIAGARERARALNIPMRAPHLRERRIPSCIWPWTAVYITADAYVTPCCNLADPAMINFGNLKDMSMQDIWESSGYTNFRRRMVSKNPYPACIGCPYYDGTFKVFFD